MLDNLSVSKEPTLTAAESPLKHLENMTAASPSPLNSTYAAMQPRSRDAPRMADINTTFCENILAELQALPDVNSYRLRRALNRTMWDILDDCKAKALCKTQLK